MAISWEKTCQAVVFQGYHDEQGLGKITTSKLFDGGFLLLGEVENAEIVFEVDEPQRRSFISLNYSSDEVALPNNHHGLF